MNIGMVTPYSWDLPGGVNRHVEQLSQSLRRRGHEVTIIAPGGSDGDGFISVGGSIPVHFNRSVANLSFGPRVAARIRRVLREADFELLHLHEPLIPSVSMLALYFSRAANLATFHAAREKGSLAYRAAAPLLRPLARRIDLRAVVSPAAHDLVGHSFPGEYTLLPNGVDTELFAPHGPVLEDLEEGPFYLVFVGRPEPRKGLDVLLEAMPILRGAHPEVRLLVVGAEGGQRKAEGVVWLGRIADELVPAAYRSARIMVAPSLGGESFGIVLLEAMACGMTVVASDIPGYRAVLENGKYGRLVPPGDAAILAKTLAFLVEDEEERKTLSEAALLRAREYSWERLVVRVEEAYRAAVEKHERGA